MAVLPDPDRVALWSRIMSDLSAEREGVGALTKADLRAAVNAADVWADANATAYNTALPQPARSVLTARQKARLLACILRRRYEVS